VCLSRSASHESPDRSFRYGGGGGCTDDQRDPGGRPVGGVLGVGHRADLPARCPPLRHRVLGLPCHHRLRPGLARLPPPTALEDLCTRQSRVRSSKKGAYLSLYDTAGAVPIDEGWGGCRAWLERASGATCYASTRFFFHDELTTNWRG
jgi:hypothetical protein